MGFKCILQECERSYQFFYKMNNTKEKIRKRWWVILIVLFIVGKLIPGNKMNEALKSTISNSSSKGNELPGEPLDYCPVCSADAKVAYVEQYGQIVKTGSFCKGYPMVCYKCAKKLQSDNYKCYRSQ
jgi:hypothetical protein